MKQLLKVFLIEYAAVIQTTIHDTLESMPSITIVGYADHAPSTTHALQTLEIDAILADLNLREGSGLQVPSHPHQQRNLKSNLCIVLTNHATPYFKKACEGLGVDHFFNKSLNFDRAVEVLKIHALSLMRGKYPFWQPTLQLKMGYQTSNS